MMLSAVKNILREFSGNPSCLAAILLAALFALLTYRSLREERMEMHERQKMLIEKCIAPHVHTGPDMFDPKRMH